MKFFIFSLVLHIIVIFYFGDFPKKDSKPEIKNIVVYLSEEKIEGKGNPSPAPVKNIEIKENKIEDDKKIENKKENKRVEKKVKKTDKKIKSSESKKTFEKREKENINPFDGLTKDGKGTYIADQRSSQGIGYKVRREIDPIYPEMAIKMGFKNEIVIQTKFLVGLDGKIEEIVFLNSFNKYGFQKEVEKALKKWEFEPIIYEGKNIKMYFYKDFRFSVK